MQLTNLPSEILIDIIWRVNPNNISKTCKFLNQLVQSNKNDIAYKKFINLGMNISINSSYTVYKYYMDNRYKLTSIYNILYKASQNGNLEVVRYLVENSADVHHCDGWALRRASENGHLEVVKYLVKCGADIHVNNDIALRLASQKGHLKVVKYLVECGADILLVIIAL
jgi:ankyrin repeat protein